jgi:hypothetical protein
LGGGGVVEIDEAVTVDRLVENGELGEQRVWCGDGPCVRSGMPATPDLECGLRFWIRLWLVGFLGEADDDEELVVFHGGAEEDAALGLEVPEVIGGDGAVFELAEVDLVAGNEWFAVEDADDLDEFRETGFEFGFPCAGGFEGGLEGDFLEFVLLVPGERECAWVAADGVFGVEDAVESGAGEHGVGHVGCEHRAGLEFVDHAGGGGGCWGSVCKRVVVVEPEEVIGVDFREGDGDFPVIAADDGEMGMVAFDETGVDGFVAPGIAPGAEFGGGEWESEK